MKSKTHIFIIIVSLTFLSAWVVKQTNDIVKAEWLLGTWENKTKRGSIYESWSKKNSKEFLGTSYLLKEQEQVVFETIQLIQEHDGLFYIPTVKEQNAGLPVRFKAKTVSRKQLVFENLQHDFPQIITYTRISADSLLAEISGTRNGQERTQSFPMKRVK